MLDRLTELGRWFHEPPPDLILEITEAVVALACLGKKSRLPQTLSVSPLAEGSVDPSPIRENIHNADARSKPSLRIKVAGTDDPASVGVPPCIS